MSSVVFTGECWIAEARERPDLDEGGFGAGWNHIGSVGQDERKFWNEITKPSRRSADLYISIFQEDLTEFPARFWLGVEWLTGQLYVATGLAEPRVLARRLPETHPGLTQRPFRYLSARVTADKGRPLLERIR